MDKEYMLLKIKQRMKELKQKYNAACQLKDIKGKELSDAYAASVRCSTKRDMDILNLIEYLLITSKSVFIEDPEAIEGFDKLTEPMIKGE